MTKFITAFVVFCGLSCAFALKFGSSTKKVPVQGVNNDGDPSPPIINKQFTLNYTISAVDYSDNSTELFSGFLALDYKNGGGRLEFSGEEYVPIYISTNFIVHPDPTTQELIGYMFEAPLCWNMGSVPIDFLVLFPLEIPDDATFIGNVTVNGQLASKWLWSESYEGYSVEIEMWVAYSNSAIERIYIRQIPYIDILLWEFTNQKIGPFNPKIYGVPNLNCQAGPTPESSSLASIQKLLKSFLLASA